ncbi:MAG: DCL family protein [Bryobacterales bacterium]|nr:DCL family protein [Bryobacterales bacterium]
MAKPVEIGTRSFRTQKSALDYYKEILHRYQDGQRITDPGDHAGLVALIERYDPVLDAVGEPTKGGGQIAHFERRLNTGTGWSSSGFWVVRQDGSATDFSYIDAVKGKPKGISQDFHSACRHAVSLDLILAKKQAFEQYGDDQGRVECELTGKMVTFEDAHLDHAWPYFSHLVSGFRAARGWSRDIPDGIVSAPADGQTTATFLDTEVADAFRAFHHDQAVMRILSREANLQTSSSARRPRVARPVQVGEIGHSVTR